MSFTQDDLKDGMVCTLRDGSAFVKVGNWLVNLNSRSMDTFYPLGGFTQELLRRDRESEDIMKITYGGKTVFEREEWRELTINEAFELLKSGPVIGEAGEIIRGEEEVDRVEDHVVEWGANTLRSICPFSEEPYRTGGRYAHKFRIKK